MEEIALRSGSRKIGLSVRRILFDRDINWVIWKSLLEADWAKRGGRTRRKKVVYCIRQERGKPWQGNLNDEIPIEKKEWASCAMQGKKVRLQGSGLDVTFTGSSSKFGK